MALHSILLFIIILKNEGLYCIVSFFFPLLISDILNYHAKRKFRIWNEFLIFHFPYIHHRLRPQTSDTAYIKQTAPQLAIPPAFGLMEKPTRASISQSRSQSVNHSVSQSVRLSAYQERWSAGAVAALKAKMLFIFRFDSLISAIFISNKLNCF